MKERGNRLLADLVRLVLPVAFRTLAFSLVLELLALDGCIQQILEGDDLVVFFEYPPVALVLPFTLALLDGKGMQHLVVESWRELLQESAKRRRGGLPLAGQGRLDGFLQGTLGLASDDDLTQGVHPLSGGGIGNGVVKGKEYAQQENHSIVPSMTRRVTSETALLRTVMVFWKWPGNLLRPL